MSKLMHRALEGLSTLGADAEVALKTRHLSKSKLDALEEHPDLLEALDNWTLMADRDLIPKLKQLAEVVQNLYQFSGVMTLYRGFDPKSPFQETLGLAEKGFFSNNVKHVTVGDKFKYSSDTKAVSFSTDEKIASAFGKLVVSCRVDPQKTSVLVYTDELAAHVSKRRNLRKQTTQKEVVLLPPFDQEFTIVET